MEWKNKLTRTPYLVFFVVLLSIGVGTASALITITLAGNVIITDDLTVDTDTLTVDSINDKVGIGTTSPTSALHITAGGSDFSPNENGIQLTGFDIGGNAGIELTTHGGIPFIDFHNDTDGSDYDARIILRGDDALAIRGANVGIDTNDPQAKLHVEGNVLANGNFTYFNNQTRSLVIPFPSFVPSYRTTFDYDNYRITNFANLSIDGGQAILYAPLLGIPDGAIIKNFSCSFADQDPDNNFEITCWLIKSTAGSGGVIASIQTTTSGQELRTLTSEELFLTHDSSEGYLFLVELDPSPNNCGDQLCDFYDIKVDYIVNQAD